MQHGEHDLGRALALVRTGRVRIDRNAAPVVVDAAPAVGQQRDRDARAEARHRLVDGVVDDLPDEVVETRQTGGSDVHSRPFADGIETFQNLDVFGAVVGCWLVGVRRHVAPQSMRQEKHRLDLRFYWRPTSSASCASAAVAIGSSSYRKGVTERRQSAVVRRLPEHGRRARLARSLRRPPARRCFKVASKKRSWVAHAGSSTSTMSLVAVELDRLDVLGDGIADGLRPAAEDAAHRAAVCAAGRSDRRLGAQRSHDRVEALANRAPDRGSRQSPCQLRCARSRSGCAASGNAPAVVSTT